MTSSPLMLASLMVAVVGCATPPPPLRPVPVQTPRTPTLTTNYKIGTAQGAGIGDAIFDVESAVAVSEPVEFVALKAHDPGHVRFMPTPMTVAQGEHFRVVGKLGSDTTTYVIKSMTDTAGFLGTQSNLAVTADGRVLGYAWESGGVGGGTWPAEPLFAVTPGPVHKENVFRAQMVYSGLTGSTVRATYREFSGDLIRAAFTQELQYNLAQDSTIAYKTIKIQVLEASNSQLRYRVREDGGLTWLPGGGATH